MQIELEIPERIAPRGLLQQRGTLRAFSQAVKRVRLPCIKKPRLFPIDRQIQIGVDVVNRLLQGGFI